MTNQTLTPTIIVPKKLTKKAEKRLQTLTTSLQTKLTQLAKNLIEIGTELNEVKSILEHGEFGTWLQSHFDMSWSTATRFMRVAEQFGDVASEASALSQRTLYLLISKEADAVREQAKERIRSGDVLSYAEVEGMIQAAPQEIPAAPEKTVRIKPLTNRIHKIYAQAEKRLKGFSGQLTAEHVTELISAQKELEQLNVWISEALNSEKTANNT